MIPDYVPSHISAKYWSWRNVKESKTTKELRRALVLQRAANEASQGSKLKTYFELEAGLRADVKK